MLMIRPARILGAAALLAATLGTAAHSQTLRIAMTASDIPTVGGIPDNGSEGYRFTGYPIYDALVNWDFSKPQAPRHREVKAPFPGALHLAYELHQQGQLLPQLPEARRRPGPHPQVAVQVRRVPVVRRDQHPPPLQERLPDAGQEPADMLRRDG